MNRGGVNRFKPFNRYAPFKRLRLGTNNFIWLKIFYHCTCREWAEKNGYTIAKEYLDEGHSAFRRLEKREALKELLADTVNKQRAFNLIIVHKLDRLFRDTLESSTVRVILKR